MSSNSSRTVDLLCILIAKGDVYTIPSWLVYRRIATSPSLPTLKGLPTRRAFRAKIGKILGKLPLLATLLHRDTSLMLHLWL